MSVRAGIAGTEVAPVRSNVWPPILIVTLGVVVALLASACGSSKPAIPAAVATESPSPSPTPAPAVSSATCSELLAANPHLDPKTMPREWSVYKNDAGVNAIVPAGWQEVSGDSFVTVTDPALAQPNNLSLRITRHAGTAPDVNTIAIAEAADVSRKHGDLLGPPDAKAANLPSGPAARLSYCIPRKGADGTTMTLAILQYLIPRQTTPDTFSVYLLQEMAPVEKMAYYGAIFEVSAGHLKLP